ncbi:MAG TPA: M20/M25/M40 family metallo-hydrolase [Phycisphaerae bacterium]|nr:M20/M25/M40 family metallo-hydrolase [Phycisphaerae bacterium]
MIERLMRYVATRSLSRQEHELADLVGADLERAGLAVHRQGNNIWCELGDTARPRLLLNSHLDTVPPGNGWSADPWQPRRVAGRLVGLGANDAKGCVVALITAALALHARLNAGAPLGGTVVLALTAEEEISGAGLATILDQLRPLDAALVGEPTGLVPMIAQRGLLSLRGTARGRSAHPANTPMDSPDNAIFTAARDLVHLRDFDWGPPHPLLGRCHAHVTKITGGVARNVVPDTCAFHLDIRTTPGESHQALYERLSRALRSELAIHSARLVPVETDPDAAIVQAIRRALPNTPPAGSPAMSDMVFLAGVPSVKIGPGLSARSHTPDEFITDDELAAGATAYERIAREYCNLRASAAPVSATAEGQA